MSSTEPCVSPRCRQAGRCNCLHVYEDGSLVPGSGQADDPYIHERPAIQCIYDQDGNQLIPDANRCVTLPSFVSKIVLSDGTELLPDANGVINVSSLAFNNFMFEDSEGTQLLIEDNTNVIFASDGDRWTGYALTNVEVPTIVGNIVVMPTQKIIETSGFALSDRLSGGSLEISGHPAGAVLPLVTNIDLSRIKTTQYEFNVSIGIMDELSSLAPLPGEVISLRVFISPSAGTTIPTQTLSSYNRFKK